MKKSDLAVLEPKSHGDLRDLSFAGKGVSFLPGLASGRVDPGRPRTTAFLSRAQLRHPHRSDPRDQTRAPGGGGWSGE